VFFYATAQQRLDGFLLNFHKRRLCGVINGGIPMKIDPPKFFGLKTSILRAKIQTLPSASARTRGGILGKLKLYLNPRLVKFGSGSF